MQILRKREIRLRPSRQVSVGSMIQLLESPLLKSLSFREADGDKDIQKYKRLLESDRIDMKTLRSLAWKGIPSEYRAVTWKLLLVRFSKSH